MNSQQIRCIRTGFRNDRVYAGSEYRNYLLYKPIMGKTIDDIEFDYRNGVKKKNKYIIHNYTLFKGKNKYDSYGVYYYDGASTLYAITLNDKIIYYTNSPIFAPASAAWETLTEVYSGYGEGNRNGCWTWGSVDDFDCISHFWDDRKDSFKEQWFINSLTPYQIGMLEKHNKYYIDKRIISIEERDESQSKLYHHV